MKKMMVDMTVNPSGDVDRDFVAMMVPHHQGAIDMALAVLRHGRNAQIRRLAQEIIVTRQSAAPGIVGRDTLSRHPPRTVAALHCWGVVCRGILLFRFGSAWHGAGESALLPVNAACLYLGNNQIKIDRPRIRAERPAAAEDDG
jgi:hypothetical protein